MLSLLPFAFLIIAENVTIGAIAEPYKKVDNKCLFEIAEDEIEKANDIQTFADESSASIMKFSGNNYSHTDYVIFSPAEVMIDGRYSRVEIYFSNKLSTLKQYMLMLYSFDFDMEYGDNIFAVSNNITSNKGNKIEVYNDEDRETLETFEITDVFNSKEDTYIFCVMDSISDELLNVMGTPSIDFVHYFHSPIDAKFTNKATLALSKEFDSKSSKLAEKVEGYDIVFGEGKLVVFIVSILISIVLFYAFYRKENVIYENEITNRYFYQGRIKNYMRHIGKDLLVVIASHLLCLASIAIAAAIMNSSGIIFAFDSLIFVLLLIHFVITFIGSSICYFHSHYFKNYKD